MALSKQMTITGNTVMSGDGFSFSTGESTETLNAYVKVENFFGNKEKVTFSVYCTDGSKVVIKEYSFVPEMNDSNFIAQAYKYLKTLPEFAGATDV